MNKQILPSLAALVILVAGVWLMSSSTKPMPEKPMPQGDVALIQHAMGHYVGSSCLAG